VFGRGIVLLPITSESTERPSNSELLDYLAARFAREGWSIKSRSVSSAVACLRQRLPFPEAAKADRDALLNTIPSIGSRANRIWDAVLTVPAV